VGSLSLANETSVAWLTALGCFVGGYLALRNLGSTLKLERSSFWKDFRGTLFTLHGILIVGAAVFGSWSLGDFVARQLAESRLAQQPLIDRDVVDPSYVQLLVALLALALLWGRTQTFLFRAVGLFRKDD